jgi:ribonuclease HI
MKFYVVWKGRIPGIYSSWEACKQQIDGFEEARYKSFPNMEQARIAYEGSAFQRTDSKDTKNLKPILESMSVDAACSGNPGLMEYRGVFTRTKEEIFKMGPFNNGTNNLGEFLALVHGLALMKKHQKPNPIYTDSVTAMKWVRDKKIKTTLERNASNEALFILVDRALDWLHNNTYSTQVLKWETAIWGEIPADFGRKG